MRKFLSNNFFISVILVAVCSLTILFAYITTGSYSATTGYLKSVTKSGSNSIYKLYHSKYDSETISTINSMALTLGTKTGTPLIEIENDMIRHNKEDNSYYVARNSTAAITIKGKNKDYAMRMLFKNVGVVGGKSIDAIVYIKSIYIGKSENGKGVTNHRDITFMQIGSEKLRFGVNASGVSRRAASSENIDVKFVFVEHDDQSKFDNRKVVEYPFLMITQDLDSVKSFYNEGWESISGFDNNYYVFDNTQLANSVTNSGIKWYSKKQHNSEGTNSLFESGVIAPTINGEFECMFYEGLCASSFEIYTQYKQGVFKGNPTKISSIKEQEGNTSKDKITTKGDKIIYTIEHKLGTKYKDTFSPYSSMVIRDIIPNESIYERAEVKIVEDKTNKTDVTNDNNIGKLTYNETTRTLEYVLAKKYINNIENYNGQSIEIVITTTVNKSNTSKKITNTVNTVINENLNYTAKVTNEMETKPIVYEYKSVTEGKTLPTAINAKEGNYKVTDNKQYLIGEEINCINYKPQPYSISNDEIWEFSSNSWEKSSTTMTANGAKCIGPWELTEKIRATYRYVSDSDRDLPTAINASDGKYQIIDDTSYESNSKISIVTEYSDLKNSKYREYDSNGKFVGEWELTKWSCNSDSFTNDSNGDCIEQTPSNSNVAEFIGTWTFTKGGNVKYVYYPSSDAGRALPNEITTMNGIYAVSDTNEYLKGTTVIRKNPETTENYVEYETTVTTEDEEENSVLIGEWRFNHWKDDSLVMPEAGSVTFEGYWDFYPAVPVSYDYVSNTPEVEFPKDAIVSEYNLPLEEIVFEGDLVNRNSMAISSGKYKVVAANGELLGEWTFAGWDKEKEVAGKQEIKFIGYWQYAKAGEVNYIYESKTPNKSLPLEISTIEGDYSVSDATKYQVDDDVERLNPVRTTYDVVEDGRVVGTWRLTSWDKDNDKMKLDGVTFTGYWEYKEAVNPKTGAVSITTIVLAILAFAGGYLYIKKKNIIGNI